MPSAFESDPKEREVGSLIRHQPNLPRRKALGWYSSNLPRDGERDNSPFATTRL
jgi:hypothetical protein